MFPQSLGFIPMEFVNKDLGNDSLGFSSCRQWETIPRLAITPSWLRPRTQIFDQKLYYAVIESDHWSDRLYKISRPKVKRPSPMQYYSTNDSFICSRNVIWQEHITSIASVTSLSTKKANGFLQSGIDPKLLHSTLWTTSFSKKTPFSCLKVETLQKIYLSI